LSKTDYDDELIYDDDFIMFLLFFIVRHHLKKHYDYMIMTSEQGLI